jgi:plasmid stabilization system protein ParE
MVNNKVVVWDKIAFEHFKEIYDSLKGVKNSSYAEKVKNTILKEINELLNNPEIYEQDRFKTDNDGSYRAFEKLKYRIAYRITKTQIRVLRVRHSNREPLEY